MKLISLISIDNTDTDIVLEDLSSQVPDLLNSLGTPEKSQLKSRALVKILNPVAEVYTSNTNLSLNPCRLDN